MLISPVMDRAMNSTNAYFPGSTVWYSMYDGTVIDASSGGKNVTLQVSTVLPPSCHCQHYNTLCNVADVQSSSIDKSVHRMAYWFKYSMILTTIMNVVSEAHEWRYGLIVFVFTIVIATDHRLAVAVVVCM